MLAPLMVEVQDSDSNQFSSLSGHVVSGFASNQVSGYEHPAVVNAVGAHFKKIEQSKVCNIHLTQWSIETVVSIHSVKSKNAEH